MLRFAAAALLLLCGPLPASAQLRRLPVPHVDSPDEERDPEFRRLPPGQDLRSLVGHVASCISGAGSLGGKVPSVDLFMANLEEKLRRGPDVPRGKILRNADSAREALRQAYNELAEVESPLLPAARDVYAEINERLAPVLDKDRDYVQRLVEVAEAARALVAAIVFEPPASPGRPISVAVLSSIIPLEPDIRPLSARLKQAQESVARAKALIAQAKQDSADVEALAQKAAELDLDSLEHLGQRRTRGTPASYQTAMNSRAVIANANSALQAALARAEDVVALLEQQGARKALDRALDADDHSQNAKARDLQSAERINFNHEVRLNDLIPYGWSVASDERKAWWANRARMAKGSSAEDSGKMEDATREASNGLRVAERALAASVRAVERVSALLGKASNQSAALVKRMTDVPTIKEGASPSPSSPGGTQPSKPLKVPHTLDVSDQEIIQSFDNQSRR